MCEFVLIVWNFLLHTGLSFSHQVEYCVGNTEVKNSQPGPWAVNGVRFSCLKKKKEKKRIIRTKCDLVSILAAEILFKATEVTPSISLVSAACRKRFSSHAVFLGEELCKNTAFDMTGALVGAPLSPTVTNRWAPAACTDGVRSPLTMALNVASFLPSRRSFWACSYVVRGARGTFLHWNLKMF